MTAEYYRPSATVVAAEVRDGMMTVEPELLAAPGAGGLRAGSDGGYRGYAR